LYVDFPRAVPSCALPSTGHLSFYGPIPSTQKELFTYSPFFFIQIEGDFLSDPGFLLTPCDMSLFFPKALLSSLAFFLPFYGCFSPDISVEWLHAPFHLNTSCEEYSSYVLPLLGQAKPLSTFIAFPVSPLSDFRV